MNDGNISPILLKKYISYLDWINLIFIKNKNLVNEIEKKVYKKSEIINEEKIEEIQEHKQLNINQNIDLSEIKEEFAWKYKYNSSIELPIKTTVSKIKEEFEDSEGQIDFENFINKKEIGIAALNPNFMEEDEYFTNAKKGTIMHLFLQKLDFGEKYDKEKLENLREKLISLKIISEKEAEAINMDKILKFTRSEFFKMISKCNIIQKEKPFCMKISANEIGQNDENDILVQGIIDLYVINENDEVILVDYKTDFVQNEINLIEKYKKQLEIYKKALEEGLEKKVKQVYIYSLYLNKEIIVDI